MCLVIFIQCLECACIASKMSPAKEYTTSFQQYRVIDLGPPPPLFFVCMPIFIRLHSFNLTSNGVIVLICLHTSKHLFCMVYNFGQFKHHDVYERISIYTRILSKQRNGLKFNVHVRVKR